MDNDMLTPAMETSFDRIDALLAQLLNRFKERINSSECKISLDLHDRHPVVVPPQTHSDDEICNGFQQRQCEATSLDCKHVLKSCDLVYGFHVSDGVSVPTATSLDHKFSWDLKPHSLCPEVLDPCDATDDAEISDGTQLFVRGGSLLPHSDVDDSPGGLLVSEGAFVPPETPQPLNDVMDQKGEGSVVIEVGLAGIHKCMPSVAHMGLLSDAPPDQWAKEVAEILMQSLVSVYGDSFKIEALGVFAPFVAHEFRGLHALYPFVEIQHSGALCHGNAILGFDLSYYMGIPDKGGGLEVLQKELHDQGFIKNCLVVIFLDSGSLHNFIALALVIGLRRPRYKITPLSCFLCMHTSGPDQALVDVASFVCDLTVSFKINHAKILHIWLPRLPSSIIQ
ncbi:unnamed protein product [Prunus brigantina]